MLAEGRVIGDRYEIIGKVGAGGMADVYKAQDLRLNRYVAIKVLKQEYSTDKTFVAKFRGEAQSAAGLSHPNIVNVYDVGEEGGLYYIVMELVEGITLKRFIERKGKLELKEAVGIAIQIALGMEAAHGNHIIHRDIKPQNIIISREGKVKVTDFGIAKAASSNTITAGAMGSVHYISPEQARGGYSDEKSDIYSLGVTLYEMLSGRMPFAADNTVSVALLHIQEEATPLRELDPSIPISIEKIVQKCMQKKPDRRYLTASELIADLKRAISNPNGDFVQMAAAVNDSPTIHLSDDELNQIKNARFVSSDTPRDTGVIRQTTGPIRKPMLDEDDGDEMDPKVEKIMLIGGIAAIVILAIVIIFLVIKGFNLFEEQTSIIKPNKDQGTTGTLIPGNKTEQDNQEENGDSTGEEESDTVMMPDLEGMSLSAAIDLLESSGIQSYRFDSSFSDTFEKDVVISQIPEEGTEIDQSEEVFFVISNGKEVLTVPDVYNRLVEEAELLLTESGLSVTHEYAYSDDLEAGRVISTLPERGMEAQKEDGVVIIISRGPEFRMSQVPALKGRTEEEALQLLKDAGLLGNVTYAYHDEIEEGLVITQDTAENANVMEGSTVGISVSLGMEQPNYSYIGTVVIDSNPLPDGVASAHVVIKMDQTGQEGVVLREGIFTPEDFPMTIDNIQGSNLNAGIVYVEVDGVLNNTMFFYANFVQVEN